MPDRRVATGLAVAIAALGLVLILVLAGSAALVRDAPGPGFGYTFGGYGAGLAWPVFALLSVALPGAALVAALRPDLRSGRRALAVALGAAAWIAAAVEGVRPPTSRTGVFTGALVYAALLHPDAFIPCTDPGQPLPRGVELGFGRVQDLPLWALVRVPDKGWHGSHPGDWPHTVSDSHGGLYFTVRVRGTLTGPGNYGVPAGFQYRLRIDSVLYTRPQHPGDVGQACSGQHADRPWRLSGSSERGPTDHFSSHDSDARRKPSAVARPASAPRPSSHPFPPGKPWRDVQTVGRWASLRCCSR